MRINALPFEQCPHQLIVEIVYEAVFWPNCFPHNIGTYPTLSPRTTVMGLKIDFNGLCRLQFGTYVQVHEQEINLLMPRTARAIALHPSRIVQGM